MSKKMQTGFSLVEILISVLVVSFGLLSLAGLQMTSVKGVNNAHSENIASMLTMELSERMRANPQAVADGVYGRAINCETEVKRCRGTEVCSSEETALFDLQEVACGTTVDNIKQGGALNLLPQGSLQVICVGGCDTPDVAHRITVNWSANLVSKDQMDDSNISGLTTSVIP
jgi:type IV pilus assembly protein PilV